MMRPFNLRVLMPFALVVLLLPACSDSGDEAGDSTLAPVTAEAVTDAESVLRVDSSGGTVELSGGEAFADGARVVIPPDALTEEMPIALRAQAGATGSFAPEPAAVAALVDYSFAAAGSADSHPVATPVAILANAVPIGSVQSSRIQLAHVRADR